MFKLSNIDSIIDGVFLSYPMKRCTVNNNQVALFSLMHAMTANGLINQWFSVYDWNYCQLLSLKNKAYSFRYYREQLEGECVRELKSRFFYHLFFIYMIIILTSNKTWIKQKCTLARKKNNCLDQDWFVTIERNRWSIIIID